MVDLFCHKAQQTAEVICVPYARLAKLEGRCDVIKLGQEVRLCIPTEDHDSSHVTEGRESSMSTATSSPTMERTTVVLEAGRSTSRLITEVAHTQRVSYLDRVKETTSQFRKDKPTCLVHLA